MAPLAGLAPAILKRAEKLFKRAAEIRLPRGFQV